MNVYLYAGPKSDNLRFHANQTIISNNVSPSISTNYTTPISNGFLLVAYPNENDKGSISFKIWVAPYSVPWYMKFFWYLVGAAAAVGLIICSIVICCIKKYCCQGSASSNKVGADVEEIEVPPVVHKPSEEPTPDE